MSNAADLEDYWDDLRADPDNDRFHVSRQTRLQAGGCLACPIDHQPEKVWVISLGNTETRICDRHLNELKRRTRR
jgi:hypothetical protein